MIISDIVKRLWHTSLEEVYIKPFTLKNKDREINPRNTIALICHPRGGSNWLAEILLNIHGALLIDEPLWRGFYRSIDYLPTIGEGKIKQFSRLGFYFDQPIPFNAKWEEARLEMESVLKGTFWNYGLYDRAKLKSLANHNIFIIKFNYGHLLLPWLQNNFNLKSIVLHRHPCAVVASQFFNWGMNKIPKNPSGNLPDFRYNEIYKKNEHIWKKISSKEEYLAAIWALKTKFILDSSVNHDNWLTLFYENLLTDFEEQIDLIQNFLNVQIKETAFIFKSKPSASSISKRHPICEEAQIGKWKTILSKNQIKMILKMVENFGVELYDEELMPHIKSTK